MVTGGFRSREVMTQALESNGADIIGIGRPMCVMTDAPARLLAGESELPRYENELSMLPRWLGFLKAFKTVRTMASFGVQFWYYGQIHALGTTGKAQPDLPPFTATRELMARDKKWLAARR